MAGRLRKKGEEAADVNVTPLLDIVFIMLIFFIVTATFVREDGFAPKLPEPNPEEPDGPRPPAKLLSVRADGFVQVDYGRIIDPRSTKPVIEEFFATNPDGVVVVNAAADSESGVTLTVLDQARDAATPEQRARITLAPQSAKTDGGGGT